MAPLSLSSDFSEVDEGSYIAGTISVTTTASEAKVGGSRLNGRQSLLLHNASTETVYFGPSGVTTTTGIPLFPNQYAQLSIGDVGVFLIASDAGPYTVVVQELS